MTALYNAATTGVTNNITVQKWHVFNLTQIFGAGNEPAKADLDKMIQAHYATGGAYLSATALGALYQLRTCINGDGIDDHLRVLTQSAGLNITTGAFALAMTLRLKNNTAGWLLAKNTDTSLNVQYGIEYTGGGGLAFRLNGVNRLLLPGVVYTNTWNDVVLIREMEGTLKLYANGVQRVTTATYADALTTALKLTIFARSTSTAGSGFTSAYMNNVSIYAGSKATIANIKAHRAPLCTKYGITYA
jgi:hypothetical protein